MSDYSSVWWPFLLIGLSMCAFLGVLIVICRKKVSKLFCFYSSTTSTSSSPSSSQINTPGLADVPPRRRRRRRHRRQTAGPYPEDTAVSDLSGFQGANPVEIVILPPPYSYLPPPYSEVAKSETDNEAFEPDSPVRTRMDDQTSTPVVITRSSGQFSHMSTPWIPGHSASSPIPQTSRYHTDTAAMTSPWIPGNGTSSPVSQTSSYHTIVPASNSFTRVTTQSVSNRVIFSPVLTASVHITSTPVQQSRPSSRQRTASGTTTAARTSVQNNSPEDMSRFSSQLNSSRATTSGMAASTFGQVTSDIQTISGRTTRSRSSSSASGYTRSQSFDRVVSSHVMPSSASSTASVRRSSAVDSHAMSVATTRTIATLHYDNYNSSTNNNNDGSNQNNCNNFNNKSYNVMTVSSQAKPSDSRHNNAANEEYGTPV